MRRVLWLLIACLVTCSFMAGYSLGNIRGYTRGALDTLTAIRTMEAQK